MLKVNVDKTVFQDTFYQASVSISIILTNVNLPLKCNTRV